MGKSLKMTIYRASRRPLIPIVHVALGSGEGGEYYPRTLSQMCLRLEQAQSLAVHGGDTRRSHAPPNRNS